MKQVRRSHATIALIGLALVLLMLLFLPSVLGKAERHEIIRAQIEGLQTASSRFHELVLSLRHGVTANYDEANSWERQLTLAQDKLALLVEDIPELKSGIQEYQQAYLHRSEQWEAFKRHNAVLRNSLSYFQTDLPKLLVHLHKAGMPASGDEFVATFSANLLLLALGEGADRVGEMRFMLTRLQPVLERYGSGFKGEFSLLTRHAAIILNQAPQLSDAMAALIHGNSRLKLARMGEINRALLLAEQKRATLYRGGLLLCVSLLLLGLWLLAMRYLESQRRVAGQAAFLKSVSDTVGVGVMALDENDQIAFVNSYMEHMLGSEPGKLMGLGFHAAGLHVDAQGDPVPAASCQLHAARKIGKKVHGMPYLRSLDGQVIPMEMNATPLDMNNAQGIVAVFQDISRRLEEEKDMRLAGTVFENSQQGIIVTDAKGMIIRANPAYCRMTGYDAKELEGKNPRILKSGQQDKSFYSQMWAELILHGRWQGELYNRRKNGERYAQWANIDAVQTEQGDLLYVGISSDISELVHTRERLANLAYFDTLTGLPNRVLFQDRLAQSLAQARRDQEGFALILADLDNFKAINDTLGHAAGDDLLVEVAGRLSHAVREADTVARLGGDEFALILMRVNKPEEVALVAANIIDKLSMPYQIQGLDISGGASLGVTFWPTDGDSLDVLLKNADVAMYRAKEGGRNNYQFFTRDMADDVADTLRIESGLRHALEAGQLSLYYQPQINSEGRAVSAEALMRWHSDALGWVPPSRFIPIAERCGLISALGDFALWEACKQCRDWRNVLSPDFRIAVNLSAAQFRHEGLIDRVANALHEFDLPGSALELEITESVVMEDVARGQSVLKDLKKLGCKLAIDDFGTGYSSLAYLKRFSVDVLKIDKSFIDGLGQEADDTTVAEAIVSLARSLDLDVVAEGVETSAQLETLRKITQDHRYLAQGYFYSPPVPPKEFEQRFPAFRQLKLVGEA